VVADISVRHVAAKDLPKLILIRTGDMRVRWFVLEFNAVALGASHDALLLSDRHRLPLRRLVLPLLQQQNRAGSTGNALRQKCVARSIQQCRILRAIDEAGQIAIVPVRPA
jgi:hypothetical protein